MTLNNDSATGCTCAPQTDYCAAALPDSPQCALNYHFGMLLGVDDFRAEQGFHVGRLRRHQRLLHGFGVVSGFAVDFDADGFDLRVGPGYGIDALGRDLALDVAQCVNLAKWWQKHQDDAVFDDVDNPKDALLDFDLVVCYATCLSQPVPAIATPCDSDSADIAYARICETVQLNLVRSQPVTEAGRYHLVRLWLGLEAPATDSNGQLLQADQWLHDQIQALLGLDNSQQATARDQLAREVWARTLASQSPAAPDLTAEQLCLPLARLKDVRFAEDGEAWHVSIGDLQLGIRPLLLSTQMLQTLLLDGVSGMQTNGLDLSTLFPGS